MAGKEKRVIGVTSTEKDIHTFDGRRIDADEAMKAVAITGEEHVEIDAATNKRLRRRIDLMILPMLSLVFALSIFDKLTLSYASIMGLNQDLQLVRDKYQWLGSIFYFGYLLWSVPGSRLMQRLPLAKYMSTLVLLWGTTTACTAAVKSFQGAAAVRFFLGVFESNVAVGFLLITSKWYTQREHPSRIAIWCSFFGWSQVIGGPVAYAILKVDAAQGYAISPWKVLFLVAGIISVLAAALLIALVPDNQLNAWWLSPQDRILAVERVRCNNQGIGNKTYKFYQVKETAEDPITWAIVVFLLAVCIINGGLTNFFNQLVVSFGFEPEDSLLYNMPAGALSSVAVLWWGFAAQKSGNRLLKTIACLVIGLVGAVLMFALPENQKVGRLIGFYLTYMYNVGFDAIFAVISSNIAGYTKKTTVCAAYMVAYCVGNMIGPQTYRPEDSPRYVPAQVTILSLFCVMIADLAFMDWYNRHRNAKKAAIRASPGYRKVKNQEFLDLTDGENPEFVYAL